MYVCMYVFLYVTHVCMYENHGICTYTCIYVYHGRAIMFVYVRVWGVVMHLRQSAYCKIVFCVSDFAVVYCVSMLMYIFIGVCMQDSTVRWSSCTHVDTSYFLCSKCMSCVCSSYSVPGTCCIYIYIIVSAIRLYT